MNYQSIFLLSREPHPNTAWIDFKRTQSWFWWIEKMKPDSPCRVHQVLLEIHWWVSLLWKTSKILLFKLRLHHCHLSVSTPSSAPSCCLLALSLLLTSATIALPHTSPALPACSPVPIIVSVPPRRRAEALWQCRVFYRCLETGPLGRSSSPCWCSPSLSRSASPFLPQSLMAGVFQGSCVLCKTV